MERCLDRHFELRGEAYEIWTDSDGRFLVHPSNSEIVDTDHAFDPPLTNEELLSIYDYGRDYEPMEDDVPIMTAKEFRGDRPLGTPISELSGQPGPKNDIGHPDHARYAEFNRIARSWGCD